MFECWKKQKEKDSKRKDLVALLEDSILNGAKTIDAVVVGKLPFPMFAPQEAREIERGDYPSAVLKITKKVSNFEPFQHRKYSKPEELVVIGELVQLYWLCHISEEVAKAFTDRDFLDDEPEVLFVRKCFDRAKSRGFIPGEHDLNLKEHEHYLHNRWTADFKEILINRMLKREYGELTPVAKAIMKKDWH